MTRSSCASAASGRFEHAARFTLDISAVALMKQRSHLPVMVDPSHSVGIPALVKPVAMAAAAAGADALLIDVHVAPEQALCDGKQALLPDDFGSLMCELELLAMGLGRKMAGVTLHIVDPNLLNGSAMWRTDQSRELLMNTVAARITMFADETVTRTGPITPGPSLYEWARFAEHLGPEDALPGWDAPNAATSVPTPIPPARCTGTICAGCFGTCCGPRPAT